MPVVSEDTLKASVDVVPTVIVVMFRPQIMTHRCPAVTVTVTPGDTVIGPTEKPLFPEAIV